MHWRRASGSCITSTIVYLHRVSVSCISTVYQERVSKCAHKELKTESKLFQNGTSMPKKNPKSIPYGSEMVPDPQNIFQNGPSMPKKNPTSIPYGSKMVPDPQRVLERRKTRIGGGGGGNPSPPGHPKETKMHPGKRPPSSK